MKTRHFAVLLFALAMSTGAVAWAQAPAPAAPGPDATPSAAPAAAAPVSLPTSIDSLSWLEGCWRGSVNKRDFREHWLPLRGGMLIGAGHTTSEDKTQDFEYLRIESRPDGVFYIASPSGKDETSFKLVSVVPDDQSTIFTFDNVVDAYPQHVVYQRGGEGWLYASIEGKQRGEEHKVVYPMRRVGCETNEVIRK